MEKKKIGVLAGLLLTALFVQANGTNQEVGIEKEKEYQFLSSIEYIEEDEALFDLGFDHYQYLPKDFDPFKGIIYDLDSIEYIEDLEEEFEIGDETIWFLN